MASHPAAPPGHLRRQAVRARPIASALGLPQTHVAQIEASHERCLALGLSRIERPDFSPLGRSDLTLARERNLRLHGHAAPVMEMLHEQIVNSGSMVVLTDATGIVIHSIGDDDFLERAAKVALAPGANWSEASKGTNAVGTALVAESPTLVHADEHFLHANHFLTCSAAPILDPRGNILGVLDVSGDQRSYHPHTMALVKMSARMIENQWLADHYRHAMRLHFHSKLGFIGTLMEGILAVAQDGRIVGANRSALEQLGLSSPALRMKSVISLFGTSVGGLVDHFRSSLATPLAVHADGGRTFHVHARFNWPVWSHVAEAAAVAASVAADAAPVVGPLSLTAGAAATQTAARLDHPTLEQLQTGDPQIEALIGQLRRVIDRDIPILVLGETGTGKELLARAIHAASARADRPFVVLNGSSVAESPIEAELFGYAPGVFAGVSHKGIVSKIQQAQGGTLFLDEIGDMPLALQAHLLRVLQDRLVTPLGGTEPVPVDVAIVCATHRNLREMIEAKAFRQDLFYRLNGLAVRLPPLRERTDLLALVRRILDTEAGMPRLAVSTEAQHLLQAGGWPGNVRQLFHVLRAAALMAGTEPAIRVQHLPQDFVDEARAQAPLRQVAAVPTAPAASGSPVAHDAPRPLNEVEREAIERAVAEAGGNISVAAKRLGVSRNTIYRRLRWHRASP